VIKYFKKHVGEVPSMSIGKIFPDGTSLQIHSVAAGAKRGLLGKNEHHFVFTTRLSMYAMPVPLGVMITSLLSDVLDMNRPNCARSHEFYVDQVLFWPPNFIFAAIGLVI